MKVMVIVKASNDSEAGVMPSEQLLTDMGRFNEELVQAGVMLAGEGLHPSSEGVRVRFSGTSRVVTDGPFAETKELIAGFWLWKVKSMDEAIEWVKRCPNPMLEVSDIEIRPVFSGDDFGAEFTLELREQEAALRARTLDLGQPRFEDGRELLIAGLSERYAPPSYSAITAQWHRFVPHLGQIAGHIGRDTYGVCWQSDKGHSADESSESDCAFDYLCGVEVSGTDALPADFQHVRIAARRYAVFTHTKHISQIAGTIDTIWNKWLPDSGLHAAPSPCFERYTPEFNPDTGFGGTEIWLPLQAYGGRQL